MTTEASLNTLSLSCFVNIMNICSRCTNCTEGNPISFCSLSSQMMPRRETLSEEVSIQELKEHANYPPSYFASSKDAYLAVEYHLRSMVREAIMSNTHLVSNLWKCQACPCRNGPDACHTLLETEWMNSRYQKHEIFQTNWSFTKLRPLSYCHSFRQAVQDVP